MRAPFTLLLTLTVATSAGAAAPPARLPFLENADTRAMALARQRGVPVFVEVWAPW
jgi:hypothetical protein